MFPFRLLLPFLTIVLSLSPALVQARWSLTPRFYIDEQYNDNLYLTETNEEDDFVTTLSPGLNLTHETPTGNISLDYELQRVLYADFSELDYTGHRGLAVARKDFGPRFSVGITELFIISEDPVELTGIPTFERPSIRIGEIDRYTRNVVTPDVTFRFSEDRSIRVGYRNHILRNEADDVADQDENAINALLTLRFNIQNDIEVFYEHINMDYESTVPPEPPRDHDGDEIRGRYTYSFDPRTSAFLEYRYLQRDFERETAVFFDYNVHNPRLGFTRDLHEGVTLSASGGYAIRDAEGRKDEEGFTGRADLSARYQRLTTSLYGETGLDEDFLSAESLGFNKFWRAGFTARYEFLERLWAVGGFYIGDDRYVDLHRRDRLWSGQAGLHSQLLSWLFLSFEYKHYERDSNIAFEGFENNRYTGRLTAQYDITELF